MVVLSAAPAHRPIGPRPRLPRRDRPRAQVSPEKSAARCSSRPRGSRRRSGRAEPMVVNPTTMDIDSRGRVWITEGLNYRLSRGGNRQFQRIDGRRQDQDPRGHRRRRQGRQDDRLRRQGLPRADGAGRRGEVEQGGQVPRLQGLRRQQPRPARPRRHRRRRQGRQALPAPDRLRRDRLRPRRPRDGPRARRQALLHPRRRLLLGPAGPLGARPQNFDVIDKSGRHVSSDQLANTLRVNRDGTQFEIIADRQRNNYETALELVRQRLHLRQRRRRQPRQPRDLGDGRRPLRLPDPRHRPATGARTRPGPSPSSSAPATAAPAA